MRRFRPAMMPFDLLKMRPRDGIVGIVVADGQILKRHVFGSLAGSHGSGVGHHGFVRVGKLRLGIVFGLRISRAGGCVHETNQWVLILTLLTAAMPTPGSIVILYP